MIYEVDATRSEYADEINRFNALFPDDFLPLEPRHLVRGFWWLVYEDIRLIGFAGMVPFDPFPRVGYYKRAAVLPEFRGRGIQRELMAVREAKARAATDWTCLVSDCDIKNVASANNLFNAGFRLCEVDKPWQPDSLFWKKDLVI
jgi:GNAT superfamily N-acetyltransferase